MVQKPAMGLFFIDYQRGCRILLQELFDQDYYYTMCHDLEFQESSRKFCQILFQEFAADLTFEDSVALQVNAEILHDLSNSSLITSLEMITNTRGYTCGYVANDKYGVVGLYLCR